MKKELNLLIENDSWSDIDKPKNCNIIDGKWVFKVKQHGENRVPDFKTRLVAAGFEQKGLV